jgi:hypothetical protein
MKNKKISLMFGPSNFDLIARLANARKIDHQQLLVDIIFGYFRANKDILLNEIEEYEATVKEAQSLEAKQ